MKGAATQRFAILLVLVGGFLEVIGILRPFAGIPPGTVILYVGALVGVVGYAVALGEAE